MKSCQCLIEFTTTEHKKACFAFSEGKYFLSTMKEKFLEHMKISVLIMRQLLCSIQFRQLLSIIVREYYWCFVIVLQTNDQDHLISISLDLCNYFFSFIWYLFNNFFSNVLLSKLDSDSGESSITKHLMLTRLESFLHECSPKLFLTGVLVNAIMLVQWSNHLL